MGKRLIDEQFLYSQDLQDFGMKERYIWLGLLLICDDFGWVKDDITFLKNRIAASLRISKATFKRSLEAFEAKGMILRRTFQTDSIELSALKLRNFAKWNRLPRARLSEFELLEQKRKEKKKAEGEAEEPRLEEEMERAKRLKYDNSKLISNLSKRMKIN